MNQLENHYEINIAKRDTDKRYPLAGGYVHWGTIIISDWEEVAVEKLNFLRDLFGKEYKISMEYWTSSGKIKPEWQ